MKGSTKSMQSGSRDGIYWQPSHRVASRVADSVETDWVECLLESDRLKIVSVLIVAVLAGRIIG